MDNVCWSPLNGWMFSFWTNGNSDLFKEIKAKNLSPSVCFVSVYSLTTVHKGAHSFTTKRWTCTLPVGLCIYSKVLCHKLMKLTRISSFLYIFLSHHLFPPPLQAWNTMCRRGGSSSQQWDLWSWCSLQCQDWRYSQKQDDGFVLTNVSFIQHFLFWLPE